MLLTQDLQPIDAGTQKNIYAYPSDSNKIIKIMKPEHATPNGGPANQHHLRSHRSQGIYRQFRRELLQYLQLCKNSYSQKIFTFPIETVYGFIATDQGLGLVTEKVIRPNGYLMSLNELASNRDFGDKHAQALNQFFDECCDRHVVFGEVNIAGIMHTEQRQGRPEFVLVDGIGDKLFIPFRSMSKTINSRNVRKIEAKIKSKIGYYSTKH